MTGRREGLDSTLRVLLRCLAWHRVAARYMVDGQFGGRTVPLASPGYGRRTPRSPSASRHRRRRRDLLRAQGHQCAPPRDRLRGSSSSARRFRGRAGPPLRRQPHTEGVREAPASSSASTWRRSSPRRDLWGPEGERGRRARCADRQARPSKGLPRAPWRPPGPGAPQVSRAEPGRERDGSGSGRGRRLQPASWKLNLRSHDLILRPAASPALQIPPTAPAQSAPRPLTSAWWA